MSIIDDCIAIFLEFRTGEALIMVATDVAARGLGKQT